MLNANFSRISAMSWRQIMNEVWKDQSLEKMKQWYLDKIIYWWKVVIDF
jgi:hypothetical protein